MSSNLKGILIIIGAAVISGGIPPISKIGLNQIPPLSFAGLRFLMAGILLLPFVKNELAKTRPDFWKLVGISLPSTINISLFILGIRLISSTASAIIYLLVPIATAIIAHFLIKERLGFKKIIGIIVGLVGALIVILGPLGQVSLWGNLLVLAAALSYSFYPVLSKQMQRKYSPLVLTLYFALTTAGVNLVLGSIELAQYPHWWLQLDFTGLTALLYVGIFGGAVYYWLTQMAIKLSSATASTMILYIHPITTYLWASALLGETLDSKLILGGSLTLLGVYLVTQAKNKAKV